MMLSFEDFLYFHRKKILSDKEELISQVKKFIESYNAEQVSAKQITSKEIPENNSLEKEATSVCSSANGEPMITTSHQSFSDFHFEDDEPIGLQIGGDEKKRKKLAEERRADYNKFLIEKEKQIQLKKNSVTKKKDEVTSPRSIVLLNYHDVLQQKKEEEKKYRNMNLMEPLDDSGLFHSQNEIQKLKSDRDNLSMLVDNLKKFARSEHETFTSYPHPSGRLSLPPPTVLSNAAPLPMITPINYPYAQGLQPYFQNSDSVPFQLPSFDGIANSDISRAIPPAPKPNQCLSNADYIRELDEQVKQKQLRKVKEIEEEQQHQKNIDFFPWGNSTGGGGAPMKDSLGNVITSRKANQITSVPSKLDHPFGVINEKTRFPTPVMLNSNARRHNEEYESQLRHDRYREDLRRQIEEKRRLVQEEKEAQRLEEERLALRIEEQRIRMQREYDEEQARKIRKEEELRLKQERLMQLQLEQRREQERKKKENEKIRERERLQKLEQQEQLKIKSNENELRSRSPPVPTVRAMNLDKEKCTTPETAKDPRQNVLSQLTLLRQQLKDEQQKMNATLREQKKKYKVMDRRAVDEDSDDNDETEVNQLRKNKESSAGSFGYSEKPSQWNKENIESYRDGSDVKVENLD